MFSLTLRHDKPLHYRKEERVHEKVFRQPGVKELMFVRRRQEKRFHFLEVIGINIL